LLAIDSGKTQTFKVLCDLYGTTLRRDPSYNEYLTQIGQIYFGLENASRNRSHGLFGNFIQSLFEDSEDEQSANTSGAVGGSRAIGGDRQTAEVELD